MKGKYFSILVLNIVFNLNAQVGIGTTSPKATLDVSVNDPDNPNNNDGLLIPRVNMMPNTNPGTDQNGMMLYLMQQDGTLAPGLYIWNATDGSWGKISTAEDADFFKENTNEAPTSINDNIYTIGNLAIGKQNAEYPIDIFTTTANRGLQIDLDGNSNSVGYGSYIDFRNDGDALHYGNHIRMRGTGNGQHFGTYNAVTGTGTGIHYGTYNQLTGNGTGPKHGVYNRINSNGTVSPIRGLYNLIDGGGSATKYGVQSVVNGSTSTLYGHHISMLSTGDANRYGNHITLQGTGKGELYASYHYLINPSGNTDPIYGVRNFIAGSASSNNQYGTANLIHGTADGSVYGSYNYVRNFGTGDKFAVYANIDNLSNGTHYGVYSDIPNTTTGFAGYFLGRVALGTTASNNYVMPQSRGTDGQVMVTDANGVVSWEDDEKPGLRRLANNSGYGYRISNVDDINYGAIGEDATDLSTQNGNITDGGATGLGSFASGYNTKASGPLSSAFNSYTEATHSYSSAFGFGTKTGYPYALVTGYYNEGNNNALFEIGNGSTVTDRKNAFQVDLNGTVSAPEMSNAEITADEHLITKGYFDANIPEKEGLIEITNNNNEIGYRISNDNAGNYGDIGALAVDMSHQGLFSNKGATGDFSFAQGSNTLASGFYASAFGFGSVASADYSAAFNKVTQAVGYNSFAANDGTYASGNSSMAINKETTASGDYSFASGSNTTASALKSSAFGDNTTANKQNSAAFGFATETGATSSLVIGKFNSPDPNALFEIGNGTNNNNRNTAFKVHDNGNVFIDNMSGSVAANLVVTADGKLEREEYDNQVYSVTPLDFVTFDSNVRILRNPDYVRLDAANDTDKMYAPLHLPNGASLVQANFHYADNDLGVIRFRIKRYERSTATTTILQGSSVDSTGNNSANGTLNINYNTVIIDNQNNNYFIEVELDGAFWSFNEHGVYGVSIGYSMH